jgi:hypothetical protein
MSFGVYSVSHDNGTMTLASSFTVGGPVRFVITSIVSSFLSLVPLPVDFKAARQKSTCD